MGKIAAAIRRPALDTLKINKAKKGGIKAKRLQAGWDNDYLQDILMAL